MLISAKLSTFSVLLPIYRRRDYLGLTFLPVYVSYSSVSQPPGRGPVPDRGINYTGP